MEILMFVAELIVIVAFVPVTFYILIPLAIYFNARADKHFTTLPEGEIKFIVSGDTLQRILVNVPGYEVTGEGMMDKKIEKKTLEKEEEKRKGQTRQLFSLPIWANKMFGFGTQRTPIYFVGLDYPKTRVYVYEYVWDKFIKQKTGYIIENRDEWVNSLYWRYPYPVQVKEIDLQGNFQADIMVIATIEIVYPYKPVFVHKGKWFSPVIGAITGAITNYARDKTFNNLREDQKEGENAELVKAVKEINERLKDVYGVEVANVDFVSLDPSEGQKEVVEALKAAEIAKAKAEAVVNQANGDRDAAIARRTGEAKGLDELLKTAHTYGPKGLEILQADLTSRNLGQNSNMQTLVLSGGQTPIIPTISLDPKKEPEKKSESDDKK